MFWKAPRRQKFAAGWPYWVGGILLAVLNIFLFAVTGEPWGITLPIARWGARIWMFFGGHPEKWRYFRQDSDLNLHHFFSGDDTWLVLGMIAGSCLSALMASEFRWRKIKERRQVLLTFGGGILMGLGARLAYGCNVGAFFSGISSLSLHGWVFALFTLAGTYVGTKLLTKLYR